MELAERWEALYGRAAERADRAEKEVMQLEARIQQLEKEVRDSRIRQLEKEVRDSRSLAATRCRAAWSPPSRK